MNILIIVYTRLFREKSKSLRYKYIFIRLFFDVLEEASFLDSYYLHISETTPHVTIAIVTK